MSQAVSTTPPEPKPNPLSHLLRQRTGPMTEDLLRTPGKFGLGQIPLNQEPDATTSMTCGFCATGCSLNIHLQKGEAINLTPATDSPVNLGMACPKGWESLSVLNSPDRATTPLLKDARGRLQPVDWTKAMQAFCVHFQSIQRQHGPESCRLSQHGPNPQRRDGLPRQPRQIWHGHRPRRRQHPPVHGLGRRRLQTIVRLRRPALHLPRLRGVRRHRPRRLEPLHRPPHPLATHRSQPPQPPRSSSSTRA